MSLCITQLSQEINNTNSTNTYSQNDIHLFKTQIKLHLFLKPALSPQTKYVTLIICYSKIKGINVGNMERKIHDILFMFHGIN